MGPASGALEDDGLPMPCPPPLDRTSPCADQRPAVVPGPDAATGGAGDPRPGVLRQGQAARRAVLLSATLHLVLVGTALLVAGSGRQVGPARALGLGTREAAVLLEPPRLDLEPEERASEPDVLALAPPLEPTPAPAPVLPEAEPLPELEALDVPEAPPTPPPDDPPLLAAARRRLKPAPTVAPPAAVPAVVVPPAIAAPATAPAAAAAPPASADALRGSSLRLRHGPKPPLPPGYRLEGEVSLLLLFHVGPDGALGAVRVAASSGDDRLDLHVRDFVARTWRFEPTDAPRWVTQAVRYRPAPR